MGSVEDHKIKTAQETLQSRLEEVFDNTSTDCQEKLEELGYPPLIGEGTEGDFLVRAAIRSWRDQLLECIAEGFELFLNVARESQEDTGSVPADIAKKLTWETIDQTFRWAPEDQSASTRFEEWLSRAAYPEPPSLLGTLPREYGWQAQTAAQLTRDFRARFKRLLNQLRNEAFLNAPTAHSTTPADSSDSNASGIQSGLTHSEDYRTITVSGKHYVLTSNQALIIRALHEASVKGIQAVSAATLRKSIGVGHGSRIRDSFRGGDGQTLWRKFVVQEVKGMYTLKLPSRR